MKNSKMVYESIMKDISKSVKKHFNENLYGINVKHSKSIKPNEVEFIVAFNDAVDEEGIPFSVKIFVEYEYSDDFRNFLEQNSDNIIYKAQDEYGDIIV